MKNKDIDKFREELNDDIDKIIEEDESEKEGTFFKPSHLFLTISIVFLYLDILKVFVYLVLLLFVFGSSQMKSKYLRNRKRKKIQTRF